MSDQRADIDAIDFAHDRLVHVYGESSNMDFMIALRRVCDRLKAAEPDPNPPKPSPGKAVRTTTWEISLGRTADMWLRRRHGARTWVPLSSLDAPAYRAIIRELTDALGGAEEPRTDPADVPPPGVDLIREDFSPRPPRTISREVWDEMNHIRRESEEVGLTSLPGTARVRRINDYKNRLVNLARSLDDIVKIENFIHGMVAEQRAPARPNR